MNDAWLINSIYDDGVNWIVEFQQLNGVETVLTIGESDLFNNSDEVQEYITDTLV